MNKIDAIYKLRNGVIAIQRDVDTKNDLLKDILIQAFPEESLFYFKDNEKPLCFNDYCSGNRVFFQSCSHYGVLNSDWRYTSSPLGKEIALLSEIS